MRQIMRQILYNDVAIAYNGITVVSNINFSVEKGDYLCIIGENGSGKSTLIKSMLGLVPVHSGKIIFENGFSKKQIGYLPQQTLVQRDFPASVFEIVLSGFLNDKGFRFFYNTEHKKMALENMQKLGIYELKNKCYRELSGGQQQRTLLARALCATKGMLVLAEPISGLDPNATAQFYGLINELSVKEKLTIVMISHDINFTISHANKILHVKSGGSFYGTADEYLKASPHQQFLGEFGL